MIGVVPVTVFETAVKVCPTVVVPVIDAEAIVGGVPAPAVVVKELILLVELLVEFVALSS